MMTFDRQVGRVAGLGVALWIMRGADVAKALASASRCCRPSRQNHPNRYTGADDAGLGRFGNGRGARGACNTSPVY